MVRGFTGGERGCGDGCVTRRFSSFDGLATGYGGRTGFRRTSASTSPRRARCGARAERRRQDDALQRPPRRVAVARGAVSASTAPSAVPQTERSRLDYPVSALDVALMGTLVAASVVAAARPRASVRSRRGARHRVGLARPRRRAVRRPVRRPAPARARCARARAGRPDPLLLDEPFTGVDRPSDAAARRRSWTSSPRRRGRHRRDARPRAGAGVGSRAVPEPADGRVRPDPAEVLTLRGARAATYGAEIVAIPGDDAQFAVLPPPPSRHLMHVAPRTPRQHRLHAAGRHSS